jgi:hypothetical protein
MASRWDWLPAELVEHVYKQLHQQEWATVLAELQQQVMLADPASPKNGFFFRKEKEWLRNPCVVAPHGVLYWGGNVANASVVYDIRCHLLPGGRAHFYKNSRLMFYPRFAPVHSDATTPSVFVV